MRKKLWSKYFNLLIKLALTMLVSIMACFFVGLTLSNYFSLGGTSIVLGVFIGVGIGFYFIYLQLKSFF